MLSMQCTVFINNIIEEKSISILNTRIAGYWSSDPWGGRLLSAWVYLGDFGHSELQFKKSKNVEESFIFNGIPHENLNSRNWLVDIFVA